MTTTKFPFEPHLKHPHIRFALQSGIHTEDFPPHKHEFSELFLVISGTGNHSIGGFNYPLVEGDVFVIHGDTEHSFTDVNNLELVNLMFDQQSPIFDSPELRLIPGYQALFHIDPIARQKSEYSAKLNLNKEQTKHTVSLIRSLEEEYHNAPAGFETMLKSLLGQFVVTLSRYYQGEKVETNNSTLVLSRALVFIEQHFTESNIKTEDIASSAYIGSRQLERLFKNYLQTSPSQYLKQVRLRFAEKILIQDKGKTIQAISDHAGFSDSNYFAKCFRQEFGCSPRDYRAKAS
ncbi:AraC family transcriptional regulator [Vibrio sp. JC009]|uniref:AraC family transcriptional regulator n=1 Tax=Vibrio sp. JC009 TaxID=2912314 RepID=UPI0023AEE0C7|nr:AraC family transcriptional regulator [Vibrio sp. JC009]WED23889.1 AraC family transcriptional regulator [Vibrio sp. JC009]